MKPGERKPSSISIHSSQAHDQAQRHVHISTPIDVVDQSTPTMPTQNLLNLPLCRHVWFCWPLRQSHGNLTEGVVCITDHTSSRAFGSPVGLMMMVGKAELDDSNAILELVQHGMAHPMTTSCVWGRPRRPTCIVIDGLLAPCFEHGLASCANYSLQLFPLSWFALPRRVPVWLTLLFLCHLLYEFAKMCLLRFGFQLCSIARHV